MSDEDLNKVFDVSKPDRVGPSATSRPVIVGHTPTLSDPMVREDSAASMPQRSSIPVSWDDSSTEHPVNTTSAPNMEAPSSANAPADWGPTTTEPDPLATLSESHFMNSSSPSANSSNQPPTDSHAAPAHPLPMHNSAKPKRNWLRWLLWLILLAVVAAGAYLAYNHFHKNNQPASQPVITPVATPKAVVSTVPQGFTQYKLADTSLSFAYPTDWGTPVTTTDLGFSKRGAGQKSDGTYAYLVNFSQTKDVQVVVTSGKILPPARGAQYYDFLQWCTGTADGKFYKSLLHFTTDATKIDTPTTTTCDQGPLADATKLDLTTIVQLKTKNPDGSALGDLYTKNLTDKDLPVLRVKDAVMTNGDNIKKLLATVKASASTTPSTSGTGQ